MTDLYAELATLSDIAEALKTRRVLPSDRMRPTRRVLDRVLKTLDTQPALSEVRLDAVRREILAAQKAGRDLATLDHRLLKDSISLLWPRAADKIDRRNLAAAIFANLGKRSSLLRRLIDAWLRHFEEGDETFFAVARLIDRHLAVDHRGILAAWKEVQRTYELFDATSGPGQLAGRILGDAGSDMLKAYRLDTPARSASGYLRATHLALCLRLPKELVSAGAEEKLERAMRFFAPDNKLRFDSSERRVHGAMADAMVAPWTAPRPPSETMKMEVLAQLRLHLGDPRINEEHRWDGTSERTRQVVRSWLSKLSLDAFFDVVGRFAGNAGMGHQWQDRREFWATCLRDGHIRDSWLVLGTNVARSIADNRELRGSYGHLIDGDPNHSVLLMQIGDVIFSEWTHNGTLRAWPTDWQNVPRLFQPRYARSNIRVECLQFPPPRDRPQLGLSRTQGIAHNAAWRGRVAALLLRKQGIALPNRLWLGR